MSETPEGEETTVGAGASEETSVLPDRTELARALAWSHAETVPDEHHLTGGGADALGDDDEFDDDEEREPRLQWLLVIGAWVIGVVALGTVIGVAVMLLLQKKPSPPAEPAPTSAPSAGPAPHLPKEATPPSPAAPAQLASTDLPLHGQYRITFDYPNDQVKVFTKGANKPAEQTYWNFQTTCDTTVCTAHGQLVDDLTRQPVANSGKILSSTVTLVYENHLWRQPTPTNNTSMKCKGSAERVPVSTTWQIVGDNGTLSGTMFTSVPNGSCGTEGDAWVQTPMIIDPLND